MLAGSHAYGTNIETSDVDYRGIFVAPPICIRTPFFTIKEQEDVTEEDTKYHELNHFMKLAVECNPNVIELLWTNTNDVIFSTPAYEHLRSYAPQLLCSKIAYTTSGYALAQLKRLKGHYKWINNPMPEEQPRQCDFVSLVHNFTDEKIFKMDISLYSKDHRLVPYSGNTYGIYPIQGYELYDIIGNLNDVYDGDSHTLGEPKFIVKFNKSEYEAIKDKWHNYWTWKKNRNPIRAKLEEEHQIDTKHAMHLVRLLRMGEEALETGVINVKRPDAAELLDIRAGAWKYEDLVAYAEEKDRYIRDVLYKKTSLPRSPDLKLAAKLVMEVQDIVWSTGS